MSGDFSCWKRIYYLPIVNIGYRAMSMKTFLRYLPSLRCIAAFNFANLMQIVFTIQAHLESGFT